MYILRHKAKFAASHNLENYEGKCSRNHGHTYFLEIAVASKSLNEQEMVIDFTEIKKIYKEVIDDKLDHWNLNEVLDFNPTTENLAKYIYGELKQRLPLLVEIIVWESPENCITYRE
jgi:6-pyruvoyltetrahydropterin/6-carboxytetrahydropterin synthase